MDASARAGSLDPPVLGDAASELDGETDAADGPGTDDLPAAGVVLCEVFELNMYTAQAPATTQTPRINKRICQLTMESLRAVALG